MRVRPSAIDSQLPQAVDIIVGYKSGLDIPQLYKGSGDGSFTRSTDRLVPSSWNKHVLALALADLNADGALDVLIGTQHENDLLFGRGDGTFVADTASAIGGLYDVKTYTFVVADLNLDGALDIIVGGHKSCPHDSGDGKNRILLNDGSGNFTEVFADGPIAVAGGVRDGVQYGGSDREWSGAGYGLTQVLTCGGAQARCALLRP